MDTGVQRRQPVRADRVDTAPEGTLPKYNRKYNGNNHEQDQDVRDSPDLASDQIESVQIGGRDASAAAEHDLGDPPEDNLRRQRDDHRGQLLEPRQDKAVQRSADRADRERRQDDYDKRCTRIADDTAHRRGEADNRAYRDIDLPEHQDVGHREHQEYLGEVNRHLAQQALRIIEIRIKCAENIYRYEQEHQNAFPA